MTKKLSSGTAHILTLIAKGADETGWAPVSKVVAQVFSPKAPDPIPPELFEFKEMADGSGFATLTEKGKEVVRAMAYL